jgi:hypothetical protein
MDKADAAFDGHGVFQVVQAEDSDFSAVPSDDIQDELDQGCFAGAVGTDQAHDVSLRKKKRHIPESESVISFPEVQYFQNIVHGLAFKLLSF